MAAQDRILVVEDDQAIALGLVDGLRDAGFEVIHATDGTKAIAVLTETEKAELQPRLVLLDVRLGVGPDGFEVLKRMRTAGCRQPVIMLTARDEEVDRVLGLELGADDYVVKPYKLRELISRVKAQLRRAYGEFAPKSNEETINFGELSFDPESLRLHGNGSEIFLTPVELRLLRYFLDNQDMALSRRQIIDSVWGSGFVFEDDRTVDVHVRHLREKIEPNPSDPTFLQTVRGYGYRFVSIS